VLAYPRLRNLTPKVSFIILILALSLCVSNSAFGVSYQIESLGTLGGTFARAYGVSGAWISGQSKIADGSVRGFLWSNGDMHELATLGGTASHSQSVNAQGIAAGYALNALGNSRPAVWDGSGVIELPTLGGTKGSVWDISDDLDALNNSYLNSNTYAVGNSFINSNTYHATLWSGQTAYDLGTLGGAYSNAYGTSSSGWIVGEANDSYGSNWATAWVNKVPQKLGGFQGGSWSTARAVNSNNQVIFYGNTSSSNARSALWSNGGYTEMGTLGGSTAFAYGLNDMGLAVGESELSSGFVHAFVYNNGLMQDLGTLGGYFSKAYAIDNNGVIVGMAYDQQGQTHAVRWVPVPEPNGAIALTAILGALACNMRNRRRRGNPLA
jgi:probable HAF family extracellular repeat protein